MRWLIDWIVGLFSKKKALPASKKVESPVRIRVPAIKVEDLPGPSDEPVELKELDTADTEKNLKPIQVEVPDPEIEEDTEPKMKYQIGRYSLPVFRKPNVSSKTEEKVGKGSQHLVHELRTVGSDEWARIGDSRWIVAASNGHVYALPVGSADVSPDSPDAAWRTALVAEQKAQAWVHDMKSKALGLIDVRANSVQKQAAMNMVSIIGIKESPRKSNRGPALSGLVGEYVEHYRIAHDKMSKGLAWCALSGQWAQAEAMGLKWADPDAWKAHPLKNWYGAVWMQEKAAKEQGLWVPCSELKGDEVLTGCLLVQIRSGSGSDAGSSGIGADGSYAGHVDIILGWKDANTLWCVGGNIGDTAKLVERGIRKARCRGIVKFG